MLSEQIREYFLDYDGYDGDVVSELSYEPWLTAIEKLEAVARAADDIAKGEDNYLGQGSATDYDAILERICEELREVLQEAEGLY